MNEDEIEDDMELEVRRLPIQHLDAAAFEPYGVILGPETADSPNFNRAPGNLGFLWVQRAMEFPTQPYLGSLRYYYRSMRCAYMQKHPASTIVLIPMGGQASVIYLAVDDGADRPDPATLQAVLLDGRNGVVLHPGTWVRYAFPVGPWVDFAYVTQRVDPATANTTDDTVRFQLHEEYGIVLDVEFARPVGAELGPGESVTALPTQNPPFE
jgi:ureidoglycolate hydrolase